MIKYNRIMERVCVTPAMYDRLQAAAQRQPPARKRAFRRLRTYGALAACLLLVLGGGALLRGLPQAETPGGGVAAGGVTDCDSIAALAEGLTFPLSVPSALPEGYAFESAANQFGLAVVVYADGGGRQLKFCMGEGEDALLGNYSSGTEKTIAAKNAVLTDEGEGFTIAAWRDGAYSYCVYADTPLDEAQWTALIESVAPFAE